MAVFLKYFWGPDWMKNISRIFCFCENLVCWKKVLLFKKKVHSILVIFLKKLTKFSENQKEFTNFSISIILQILNFKADYNFHKYQHMRNFTVSEYPNHWKQDDLILSEMAQCKMWLTLSSPLNGLHHLLFEVNKKSERKIKDFSLFPPERPFALLHILLSRNKCMLCFLLLCAEKKIFSFSRPLPLNNKQLYMCKKIQK